MSMTVEFYTSTANPKQLDKSGFLTLLNANEEPIAISPTEDFDEHTPILIMAYNETYYGANYCQISGTYYFITEQTKAPGNRMILTLRKDVLYSNCEAIKALPAIASRTGTSGNLYSSYLVDNEQKLYAYQTVATKLIGTFNYATNLLLMTAG